MQTVGRQMIPGSNVSRTLARTGVDWVLVDCEWLRRMKVMGDLRADMI
jgi:hypothetical protein